MINRQTSEKNRMKKNAIAKEYYKENSKSIRAKRKKRYYKNREKEIAYSREYYEKYRKNKRTVNR